MRPRIYRDEALMANAAAGLFVSRFQRTVQKRSEFRVCLSGGSTPKRMLEVLASDHFQKQLNWSQIHVFWCDERLVPPDHPESNFRLAWEALLKHVPIPENNIHRFRTELLDPQKIVLDYEKQLAQVFHLEPTQGAVPRFDLVYLGLGEDGHTASLFPDLDLSQLNKQWVFAAWVPHLGSFRLSLGGEILNHSKLIAFLVSGKKKAGILRAVLEAPRPGECYPAQSIQPVNGKLLWLLDREAAQDLSKKKRVA